MKSVTKTREAEKPTPQGTAGEVFRAFLKLGLTSFGGHIAHLGYFRDELVTRRKWIDEPGYADLVALGQFLPGPASSQVGFALGLLRGGPLGALAPGVAERRTHTYIRHGTTSLFAALDIATGAVIGKCYKRHRATEFLDFLKRIDQQMPEGPDVHIVMDDYATHKTPKIKAWLARRPHWHIHFTPTSASWINQ